MWPFPNQSHIQEDGTGGLEMGMGPASLEESGLTVEDDPPKENWEVLLKHEGGKAGQAETDMYYNYYAYKI